MTTQNMHLEKRAAGHASPFLALILCLTGSGYAEEWPNRHLMGINLDRPTYFDTSVPFADLMKRSNGWQYGWEKDAEIPKTDAMGHWIPEPGKEPFNMVIIPPCRPPAGDYVVAWKGTGKVELHKGHEKAVVESGPNRFVFKQKADQGITVQIKESDPADPVRSISCFLPGTENQDHPFNPAFLKYLKPFGTIRYLNWIWANDSKQSSWNQRPVVEQQSFKIDERRGVPVEWIAALANETKTNPWVTIPHLADDEYVRNFAKVLKEQLDPELKVYIEYSNEIWNGARGFGQTQYSTQKGIEMGIPKDKRPHAAWYAKRSREIWEIFEEVFGGRDRHVRVVSGFAVVPADAKAKLEYLDDTSLADALAIAPYAGFSRDIRTGNFDPAGLTTDDLIAIINGQLDKLVANAIANHAKLAEEAELELIAYEGGLSYGPPPAVHKDKETAAKFHAISASPKVEETLEQYLRKWYANTGSLMCLYAYVRQTSNWGGFGNMGEDLQQSDAEAPRRRAVYKIAHDPKLKRN